MKPTTIFHLKSKDGKFLDSILSQEDLINCLNKDSSCIGSISTFSKDQFKFSDIQNQLESISQLMIAGSYMIDGRANCNKVDLLLFIQELINSAEEKIEEIKVKLSYQLDLELIFDTEESVLQ